MSVTGAGQGIRVRLNLAYDGAAFHGWQRQAGPRTVQGELEAALSRFYGGRELNVMGSGRTDAGVHAVGQVAHYDAPESRPTHKLLAGINALLPEGVRVWAAREVEPTFHARFQAVRRSYGYRLLRAPSPFADRYGWHVPYAFDLQTAVAEGQVLLGRHDFTSFATKPDPDDSPLCELWELRLDEIEDGWQITVRADRFLRRMVRSLVGTLVELGAGRREAASLKQLLEMPGEAAGVPAPPEGLALLRVEYETDRSGDAEAPPSPWRLDP